MVESSNYQGTQENPNTLKTKETTEKPKGQVVDQDKLTKAQQEAQIQEEKENWEPATESIDTSMKKAEQLQDTRKKILEEIEQRNWTLTFSELIEGVWYEKFKEGLNLVAWEIGKKVDAYWLNDKEIENIKKWIILKIIKSWKVDDLIKMSENIAKELGTTWQTSVNLDKLPQIPNLIDENMQDLVKLLEQSKANPETPYLLSNPKAIKNYKFGQVLSQIWPLEWENLKSFANEFVENINTLGDNIWKKAESFWEMIKNAPQVLKDILKTIFTAIVWFFIGDKEKARKYVDWYFENMDDSNAVDKLKMYWNYLNQRQEMVNGNWKISQLNWVNLTDLDPKELKPFFDNCRKNGIDPNSDKFWEKVFSEWKLKTKVNETIQDEVVDPSDKIKKVIQDKKVEKTYNLKFCKIEGDIFWNEKNNPDFTKFYEMLNDENFITNETKTEEEETQKAATQAQEQAKRDQEAAEKVRENDLKKQADTFINSIWTSKIILWTYEHKQKNPDDWSIKSFWYKNIEISKKDNVEPIQFVIELWGGRNVFFLIDELKRDVIEKKIKDSLQVSEWIKINYNDNWKKLETWWNW